MWPFRYHKPTSTDNYKRNKRKVRRATITFLGRKSSPRLGMGCHNLAVHSDRIIVKSSTLAPDLCFLGLSSSEKAFS